MSDDEGSKDRAQLSDSENDRSSESSDNESDELTDEKAQVIFDDWMISLSISQRKILAVLLFHSFRVRQGMSIVGAAQESASITGFNMRK